MIYDVAIIGGGPAGLTAAIYCARDKKSVIVFEKNVPGGRITQSASVKNIPGFADISGYDFGYNLLNQAEQCGVEIHFQEIFDVSKDLETFILKSEDTFYMAKSVIVAAGTKNRILNIDGESNLIGSKIHFCANCDGPFYENKVVAVIGGGNGGLTEALDLSKTCNKVYILQNLDKLTAEKSLIEEIEKNSKIEYLLNFIPKKFESTGNQVIISNQNSDNLLLVDGVFESIGTIPDLEFLKNILALNQNGYLNADLTTGKTSEAGIFACGDCVSGSIQQVVVAAAGGASAALSAIKFLQNK